MKKIKLLGLVAILAISVEGCSVVSEFVTEDKEKKSTPLSSVEDVDDLSTQDQSEETQLENESDTPTPQRVSGLIPATNPNVRVSGSVRGRQDPFAPVNIQPNIVIQPQETQEDNQLTAGQSGIPTINTPNNTRGSDEDNEITARQSGIPTINTPNNTPGLDDSDAVDNQAKTKNSEESLPALAQRVIVTGIVKLSGVTKIIIQAPEEAYARHVGIGEYVSNGQVLVKGVEGLNSASPKVVLQQKGMIVRKQIGELPFTEEEPDTTALGIDGLDSQSMNTAKTWLPNFLSQKLKDSKNN